MSIQTAQSAALITPDALRLRHGQLAHQLRHAFERIGIEHRNADGTLFVPRVKCIAWTGDGEIALVEMDEARLWHIPSTRLTNADTLRKLRRTVGQPIAVLAADEKGNTIPGIFYVVSFAPRAELPTSLRLTLADLDAIPADQLLAPIGQFKGERTVAYRALPALGHVLLGSATQRGKTSLINAWLGALTARNTPDRYQFILIDAKATTLHRWRAMPHCAGYVTDLDGAQSTLESIERATAERFDRIRAGRVDNWLAYDEQHPGQLPALHVIIDELPDFIIQGGGRDGDLAQRLSRIAGKCQGAGIFLTLAGTEMSHATVPTMVQANIATRIGFQMGDRFKSLSVLQAVGAEKLPAIKGRALWRDTDRPNQLTETQMVYFDSGDVDTLIARSAQGIDLNLGQPVERAFVPTIDGVSPALAADVARWCMTNSTSVRDVWAQFRSCGLSRQKAGDLLNEWAAQGLLSEQKSVNENRQVTPALLDLLSNL